MSADAPIVYLVVFFGINMPAYQVTIPSEIAALLLTAIKRERIHRDITVTSDEIIVRSSGGTLAYKHGTKIPERCSFVFSIDPAMSVHSDMRIEWETASDTDNAIFVHYPRFVLSSTIIRTKAWCAEPCLFSSVTFRPFPQALAQAIPSLSRHAAAPGDYTGTFHGIMISPRSAYATDGKKFACWQGGHTTSETSEIVSTYQETFNTFATETKEALAKLYDNRIRHPQNYLDVFGEESESPAAWLANFQEAFSEQMEFVRHFSQHVKPLSEIPISVPKFLEKWIGRGTCRYGFTVERASRLPSHERHRLPETAAIPQHVSFCLAITTDNMPCTLIWRTGLSDTFRKGLDVKLLSALAAFKSEHFYELPASAFSAIQTHIKGFGKTRPIGGSEAAFVNHGGKLGIGHLHDTSIDSTPTTLPCPAGIELYVALTQAIADIPVPAHVSTVTLVCDDSNVNSFVAIIVGNVTYIYARIENATDRNNKREPYPVRLLDTPLALPPAPKMRFSPVIVK